MRLGRDPAIGRLTKRPEFLAAAKGRRFHTERVTLQGLRREGGEGGLRVGFTVTKREGHATERNRIRRRLRRAILEAAGALAEAPLDLVVIGRRAAFGAPYGSLVGDLARGIAAVAKPGGFRRPAGRAISGQTQA